MMIETDLLIIGAGPAGCSAAIYAVRAGVKTVIAGGAAPGGQLLQTSDIENYAGFVNPVGGFEIMDAMHKQCKRLGVEFTTEEVVAFAAGHINICQHAVFFLNTDMAMGFYKPRQNPTAQSVYYFFSRFRLYGNIPYINKNAILNPDGTFLYNCILRIHSINGSIYNIHAYSPI